MNDRYRPRRASAGCTLEPCEGCGNPEHRKKHTLCNECRRKMAKYEQLQNEALVRGAEGARPFRMKERAYALPHFRHVKNDEALQQAFFDLSMLLSIPTDMKVQDDSNSEEERQKHCLWPIQSWGTYDWVCVRLMDPPVAEALRRVCVLSLAAVDEAYVRGVADGKDLLMSLASGRVTNDEFNDRAARLEGKPR